MARNLHCLTLLGLLVAAGAVQAEDVVVSDLPDWYFSVDALALHRSAPTGGAIVAANPALTPFLSAEDLDFGSASGVEATIGYSGLGYGTIEARLMYSKMDGTNAFTSPGNFIGVGFTGPSGTSFVTDFETTFSSGELNWRRSRNDRVSVLVGIRAMDFSDSLQSKLNGNVATGLYEAENTLLGAQIGAQIALLDGAGPFQLTLSGKAGVYNNRSNAGIREFQGNNFIGEFQSEEVTETSYAAEIGLIGEYRLSDKAVITGGYQVIWANNLALAANAASSSMTDPSLLTTNVFRDDLVLQSFKIGIKFSF